MPKKRKTDAAVKEEVTLPAKRKRPERHLERLNNLLSTKNLRRNVGKAKSLAVGTPANQKKHLFFPIDHDADKIKQLLHDSGNQNSVLFIRGGVAIGKSTMAIHLAQTDRNFILIEHSVSYDDYWRAIFRAYKNHRQERYADEEHSYKSLGLEALLKYFGENNITLVFDEAHLTFAFPNLVIALYKNNSQTRPKILLFSTAAEVDQGNGSVATTPSEIVNEYLWRPTLPKAETVAKTLEEIGILMDVSSVSFVFKFCGGHYGIAIIVLKWIQEQQNKKSPQQDQVKMWTYGITVQAMRASIGKGWDEKSSLLYAIRKSRAVRVNNGYTFEKIHRAFIQILFTGPGELTTSNLRKDLTIRGMVLPEEIQQSTEPFTHCDFSTEGTRFVVAHSLMAVWYQKVFINYGYKAVLRGRKTSSCFDLLARVVPHLSFMKVICAPLLRNDGSLTKVVSDTCFPWERSFHRAIERELFNQGFEVGLVVDNIGGEPDIVVRIGDQSFIFELMLNSSNSHGAHAERFSDSKKTNYKVAKRSYVTIGEDEARVRSRLQKIHVAHDVERIGLVPSKSFTSYRLVTLKPNGDFLTYSIPVDLIARSISTDGEMSTAVNLKVPYLIDAHDELKRKNGKLKRKNGKLKSEHDKLKFEQLLQLERKNNQLKSKVSRIQKHTELNSHIQTAHEGHIIGRGGSGYINPLTSTYKTHSMILSIPPLAQEESKETPKKQRQVKTSTMGYCVFLTINRGYRNISDSQLVGRTVKSGLTQGVERRPDTVFWDL